MACSDFVLSDSHEVPAMSLCLEAIRQSSVNCSSHGLCASICGAVSFLVVKYSRPLFLLQTLYPIHLSVLLIVCFDLQKTSVLHVNVQAPSLAPLPSQPFATSQL